ncbi:asparagine synthase (glutamine-hydrolyzing) [Sediminibacterium sp.]|uniref:asparagine synthase (glutamine-hydrolyzing) n=1 Tax=Sediminibacterium sp. TaxID=1917865 RepID=UPI00273270E5|nr:asparagine synthase (glutamine-hydrolyzing) [Sediminibacterium sp.]MDP3392409.1 asparagine synthase (glutamine-hydrolyzing) [Sediminibacterium sp.]MDP3565675.1 asparagine synthase (glutamine-hydrolyzing) [Sediminibacterium sp.]
MCGIFGIYKTTKLSIDIDKQKVRDSTLLMKHRGPDAYDQWGIDGLIEFAHVRLAIIDLAAVSNQPFISDCGNFIVVYNGEIYNYIELRKELTNQGVKFRTTSDTEVLLNGYITWGDKCVEKFNGDWAFCIYDIKRNRIFCSRDRFGIKPFCYTFHNNSFVFSSEIKSIINYYPDLRVPNFNVINNYCRNSLGAQHNETWFKDILRLKPAHNLVIENGNVSINRYWDYPTKVNSSIQLLNAKDEYLQLFKSSLEIRMRSDVPVGTTLSSGIDSGSIVSVLREWNSDNHKTYTAVFNSKDYDKREKKAYSSNIEIDEASLVIKLAEELDLETNFIDCSNIDLIKELSFVLYHLESGHSSPAVLPLTKVMDRASNDVRVVLEGQGADELLSGYIVNTFPTLIFELLKKWKFHQVVKEVRAFSKLYSLKFALIQFVRLFNSNFLEKIYHRFVGIDTIFTGAMKNYKRINDYPKEKISFSEKFNEVLYRSHIGGLVNLLHYGDAISMSKSIESRLPFLDYRLVEFVFQLPFEFKMQNGVGKVVHRKALEGIVPDFILHNPLKFGFNTPLSVFFMDRNNEAIRILLSERTSNRGLFDKKCLNKLIERHISKKHDYSTFLLRLLSVELWFRLFIDEKKDQKCV